MGYSNALLSPPKAIIQWFIKLEVQYPGLLYFLQMVFVKISITITSTTIAEKKIYAK